MIVIDRVLVEVVMEMDPIVSLGGVMASEAFSDAGMRCVVSSRPESDEGCKKKKNMLHTLLQTNIFEMSSIANSGQLSDIGRETPDAEKQ